MERFPRRAGVATLIARRSLTPRMIRVTLRARRLPRRLADPAAGRDHHAAVRRAGRDPRARLEAVAQLHRPLAIAPTLGEIDVDVVLHEPRGPACIGAAKMPLGGGVGYAGPRVDFVPRDDAEWLLLCGDETALPAIAAILEEPPVPHVLAVVEVPDRDEELPLDAHPVGAPRRRARRDHRPSRRRAAGDRAPGRPRPGVGRGRVAHRPRPQGGPARRARDAEVARAPRAATGCAPATGSWTTDYASSSRRGAPATSAVISPSAPPMTSGAQRPGTPAKCAISMITPATRDGDGQLQPAR